MGKASKIVTIGQGPGALNVVLVAGISNTLSLRRTGVDGLPEAWSSAPVLNLRNNIHAVTYTAVAVLTDNDTVATWVIPALNSPPPTDPNRPTESQLVLDGVPIYAGSVRCLDSWQDSAYAPTSRDIQVIAGPPGAQGPEGPPGPAGPAGAGSASLEQIQYTMSLGGRLLVVSPNTFWVDWKYIGGGVTIPAPVPITMPAGAMAIGFLGGDIAWMLLPNEDFTQFTIGGDAHGGWEYTLPTGVSPMIALGGVIYLMDGNTGEWYWTDGTAAPALITGGTLSPQGVVQSGWLINSDGDWYRVDTTTGAWIIATPPAGVDFQQYAYPIMETGDTLAWDGTGWHHLSPAGVWTPVAGGPTNPLPYTGKVTYTDTETWVGDSTPGDGRWWSPDGGWRGDHRNYPYTQMWGLADGAVWTDGTDYWRTKPGVWNSIPTPDPLLGFNSFAGDYDRVVGYNSQNGDWGYSIAGGPWVLGLRERVYLLEQQQTAIENRLTALENP